MSDASPAELFQLDQSTCLALLGVHHVGRLIVPGGDPYVIPLNYVATDGAVVFRTTRRPVIEDLIGRPVVFEVDMFDDRTRSGWSVVIRDARERSPSTSMTRWSRAVRSHGRGRPMIATSSSASILNAPLAGCCGPLTPTSIDAAISTLADVLRPPPHLGRRDVCSVVRLRGGG